MDAQNTFLKVQLAVQNAPLESILETAESVAQMIPTAGPALVIVIKLLKSLIKFRPLANNILDTSAQTAAFVQNIKNGNAPIDKTTSDMCGESSDKYGDTCILSDEEKAAAAEHAEILAMVDQMVEIAAEDGDLSPEEEKLLVDIAQEAGISESAVLAKVKMKCLQKSQKK